MKEFIKNYLLNINLLIIIILIIAIPNYAITEFEIKISDFIDDNLFGDIGLISLDRPFMSKVIANYIIISSTFCGILFSSISFFERELSFKDVLVTLIGFIIALYWAVFSNQIIIPPEKPYMKIAKDSLFLYGICTFCCFSFLSMGITTIIYLLRKTRSFIEIIK